MISCDQEDDTMPIPKKEREISAKEMRNEKNPYDNQGVLHNEFLDYFITHIDLNTKEVNREKLMTLVEDFHKTKKMDFGASEIEVYNEVFDLYGKVEIHLPGPLDRLCKYIPMICDILKPQGPILAFPDLDDNQEGTATDQVLDFIENIKVAEQKILADTQMEEIEKYALLNYTTVARHSAAYWHNEMHVQKSQSNWYNAETDMVAAYCWKCVGKSDVEGAIGGAISGALAGGVGALPGAGIGAGAASAASAVVELIDWWW
ncbi:hypothetical protein DN748_03330 [Sinomicrobium soli]|nr:hypothetical protein DN748_03330 [Sinomicrobium sp. N-1-3-6]